MLNARINCHIVFQKRVYLLLFLCFFCFCVNITRAQNQKENGFEFLYGKWYVSDWRILNITSQTNDEKSLFEKQKRKCLKSFFIIDFSTFKNSCNECEFTACLLPFNDSARITELPIVEGVESMKRYPGNEIEENKIVGKTFVSLIDKNYKSDSLKMIHTVCKTDSQNSIRILIIDNNKIGIYSGEDLIILVKKKLKAKGR